MNVKIIFNTNRKQLRKIEKNVQEATFDLGTLNTVEVKINATPVVTEVDQVYYSVIAGSFRSLENAEKKKTLLNILKKEHAFKKKKNIK